MSEWLEHGGQLRRAARHYGIAEARWLDLSTGIAPYTLALPELPASAWQRLPEADDGLEAAARDYYGCAQLLAVAGSQAALQVLPQLRAAGLVGVLSPSFLRRTDLWCRSLLRIFFIFSIASSLCSTQPLCIPL